MAEQYGACLTAPKLVVVIVDSDKESRVKEIVNDSFFLWMYVINCIGTAKSEILDLLGIGETEKSFIAFFEPGFRAGEITRKLSERLEFHKPGRGIAFTIPLSGMSNAASKMFGSERLSKIAEALGDSEKAEILSILKNNAGCVDETGKVTLERVKGFMEGEMEKQTESAFKYDLVLAVVNQGYSDELMNAARTAGARGGTIIHARRSGREETVKFFGISLQEEKEVVAILTERDNRKEIMKAVCHACGIATEAAGIVFSVPVDGVVGIGGK